MNDKKIGYLGGCWDLFHVGHLNCIIEAKKRCDFLIVDVTPDNIVFQQKGKMPFIGEDDRLAVVRAIKYVDRAELSDEKRDVGAYEKYHFNVLFVSEEHRGKEYYKELEEEMLKRGVKVVYIPYTTRISSTKIKEKIKK